MVRVAAPAASGGIRCIIILIFHVYQRIAVHNRCCIFQQCLLNSLSNFCYKKNQNYEHKNNEEKVRYLPVFAVDLKIRDV